MGGQQAVLTVHLVCVGCLPGCWGAEAGSVAEKPTLPWGVAQAVLRFDAFGAQNRSQEQNMSVCHIKV